MSEKVSVEWRRNARRASRGRHVVEEHMRIAESGSFQAAAADLICDVLHSLADCGSYAQLDEPVRSIFESAWERFAQDRPEYGNQPIENHTKR